MKYDHHRLLGKYVQVFTTIVISITSNCSIWGYIYRVCGWITIKSEVFLRYNVWQFIIKIYRISICGSCTCNLRFYQFWQVIRDDSPLTKKLMIIKWRYILGLKDHCIFFITFCISRFQGKNLHHRYTKYSSYTEYPELHLHDQQHMLFAPAGKGSVIVSSLKSVLL